MEKDIMTGKNNFEFKEGNGKGKEYYSDDKLRFEGEYLNGERSNGKGYNPEGKLIQKLKKELGKEKNMIYIVN